MAGGGVVSQGEVKHYDGRTTFFVLLTCVLAASGGLMFGYDVGISGTYILNRTLICQLNTRPSPFSTKLSCQNTTMYEIPVACRRAT
jgi:hypothetical protein